MHKDISLQMDRESLIFLSEWTAERVSACRVSRPVNSIRMGVMFHCSGWTIYELLHISMFLCVFVNQQFLWTSFVSASWGQQGGGYPTNTQLQQTRSIQPVSHFPRLHRRCRRQALFCLLCRRIIIETPHHTVVAHRLCTINNKNSTAICVQKHQPYSSIKQKINKESIIL